MYWTAVLLTLCKEATGAYAHAQEATALQKLCYVHMNGPMSL
jgi:hypothetical protein